MRKNGIMKYLLTVIYLVLTNGCIGTDIIDDYIEARISVVIKIEVMIVGDSFHYDAVYFDNIGVERPASFQWMSSNREVLEIDEDGLSLAIAPGIALITFSANEVTSSFSITIFDPDEADVDSVRMVQEQTQNGERTAILETVSSYQLDGSATLSLENGLKLTLSDDFETTNALPGLYLYLTNNTSTINNALEIGAVKEFSGGGWLQKKGSDYYKLSQYWVIADSHYTNTGQVDPNATRGTFLTSLYGEYGIIDRLTAIVYFPFFVRALQYEQVSGTTGEVILEGDAVNSVGDTQLTIKYGLIQSDKIAISGNFSLGLPFGINDGGRDGSLQTGTGKWNRPIFKQCRIYRHNSGDWV